MKTKEDKMIDAIGGLSDKNVMLTDDRNLTETNEKEIAVHEETRSKISVRRTLFSTAAAAVVLVGGMTLWSRINNSIDPFDNNNESSGADLTEIYTEATTAATEEPKLTVIVTVPETDVTKISESTETTAATGAKAQETAPVSAAESDKNVQTTSESKQEPQIKIIEGKLLNSEDLVDFNSDCSQISYYMDYDKEWAETHDKDIWGENSKGILDQIGSDEITKLWYRADMLFRLRSPEKLSMFDGYDHENGAMIEFADEEGHNYYLSSGFNYDSFIDDWHEVFTDECFSRSLNLSGYRKYGDELYYADAGYSGAQTLVHTEYVLDKQDEDEIIVNAIDYHDDQYRSHTDLEEHYAEIRDTLRAEIYQYRFVKTDKGWRIDEFPQFKWR